MGFYLYRIIHTYIILYYIDLNLYLLQYPFANNIPIKGEMGNMCTQIKKEK